MILVVAGFKINARIVDPRVMTNFEKFWPYCFFSEGQNHWFTGNPETRFLDGRTFD
jgi:hypothetical protein